MSASSATSSNAAVWFTLDPEFHRIKLAEDQARDRIMIDKDYDPSSEFILELTPDMRLHLADQFRKSRMENLTNPNVQLRSVVMNNEYADYAGNVEKKPLCKEMNDSHNQKSSVTRGRQFKEMLNNIPLEIRDNVILAGGAPLVDIIGLGTIGDFDLFIVGTSNPKKVLKCLVKYLVEKISTTRIFRTVHSVTLKTSLGSIQIVLRSYRNAAEVVLGFDLDASGCYYSPSKRTYFCTQRAYYSIKRAINFVDVDRASETYATRLTKYAFKGFSVFIPVTLTVQHFDEAHRLASNLRTLKYKDRHIKSFVELRSKFNQTLVGLLTGLILGANAFRKFIANSETDYCPVTEESMLRADYSSDFKKKPGVSFVETEESNLILGYGFNPHAYVNLKLLFKLKPNYADFSSKSFPDLEFITDNPGTQHTASFHPVKMTWDKWTESIYLTGKPDVSKNVVSIPSTSTIIPAISPVVPPVFSTIKVLPVKIPVLAKPSSLRAETSSTTNNLASQRKSCGCSIMAQCRCQTYN